MNVVTASKLKFVTEAQHTAGAEDRQTFYTSWMQLLLHQHRVMQAVITSALECAVERHCHITTQAAVVAERNLDRVGM